MDGRPGTHRAGFLNLEFDFWVDRADQTGLEGVGPPGGVAEWLKAAVLKTASPKGLVGSNPTASA